jgi:hypothetical protein
MSDISLKIVQDTMEADFRANGQGSASFTKLLQTAINMVVGSINRGNQFATPSSSAILTINNLTGTVGVDNQHLDTFLKAVGLELVGLGQRPAKGKDVKYQIDASTMANALDDVRQYTLNVAIAADTSDETNFIGLGGLG